MLIAMLKANLRGVHDLAAQPELAHRYVQSPTMAFGPIKSLLACQVQQVAALQHWGMSAVGTVGSMDDAGIAAALAALNSLTPTQGLGPCNLVHHQPQNAQSGAMWDEEKVQAKHITARPQACVCVPKVCGS